MNTKRGQAFVDKLIEDNQILKKVKDKLLKRQTLKGYKKYGRTVNPEDYTVFEWIDHIQEEIMDMLIYLETLKEKLKRENIEKV